MYWRNLHTAVISEFLQLRKIKYIQADYGCFLDMHVIALQNKNMRQNLQIIVNSFHNYLSKRVGGHVYRIMYLFRLNVSEKFDLPFRTAFRTFRFRQV